MAAVALAAEGAPMKRAAALLLGLSLTACLPPRAAWQADDFDDPRAVVLASARQGIGIRLVSTDARVIEGHLAAVTNATVVMMTPEGKREIPLVTVARLHLNHDYSPAMMSGGATAGSVFALPFGIASLHVTGGLIGTLFAVWTGFGGGLGMAIAGFAGGWQQVFPDPIHPERWMTPARMSAGALTAYVRLPQASVAAGDSLTAFVDLVNAGSDSVDVLERACGPLVVLTGPGRSEWVSPCAPGLRVTRVGPGRLTREVSLPTRLLTGPYHIEYRVIHLARDRRAALDARGAVRFSARAGVLIQ